MVGVMSWSVGRYEITPRQDIRVGTAERERTASLLSQHLSAGRLELNEFDERVKAAYGARTERDLQVLLADLPAPAPGRPRRGLPQRRFLLAVLALAAVLAVAAFAAFPPLIFIPVLFVVLRVRRHSMAGTTGWRPGRRV